MQCHSSPLGQLVCLIAQVPHQGRGHHPQADSGHHPAAHGEGDDQGGPIIAYVLGQGGAQHHQHTDPGGDEQHKGDSDGCGATGMLCPWCCVGCGRWGWARIKFTFD